MSNFIRQLTAWFFEKKVKVYGESIHLTEEDLTKCPEFIAIRQHEKDLTKKLIERIHYDRLLFFEANKNKDIGGIDVIVKLKVI